MKSHVSGGFPSSQTFPEVKVAETALAVEGGADEIDIVLNLGNFLDGDWEEVCDEISELKAACRDARLKVILETGALKTAENIRAAQSSPYIPVQISSRPRPVRDIPVHRSKPLM